MNPKITVSIVSHNQIALVAELLADIRDYCKDGAVELILTLNVPEELPDAVCEYRHAFPFNIIRNQVPQGFGENHNRAFEQSTGQFFCVLNPDIRLNMNPFPALIACLQDLSIGVASPLVVDQHGVKEDSARQFPTPLKILCKAFGSCKGSDYIVSDRIVFPDWVGGMFMLFRRKAFEQLGGFDERYFLYYEDVDLCARVRLQGYEVALSPAAKVVHHAQRRSHRSMKYMRWHVASMLRFFLTLPFLKIFWRRLKQSLSISH